MGLKEILKKDTFKTEKDDIKTEPKYKRVLIVKQTIDDRYETELIRIDGRRYLLPMLRAAEKELHVRIARHEI
jgi:hypothetical protein